LKKIITLSTLKNLKNLRKFDDLLNQKKISKELKTLIKYINFRIIKALTLASIIKSLNKYYFYYNIITYYW